MWIYIWLPSLSFFIGLFWLMLYLVASLCIIWLLINKTLSLTYKYGIISALGLFAFCLTFVRMQEKPFDRTRLFYLNDYYGRHSKKHALIREKLQHRSIYEDYSGKEIDIRNTLDKKRYLAIFESPKDFELMDVIVEGLEAKKQQYLYVNLDILPRIEAKYSDKKEFWGHVAQSIIVNFQKLKIDQDKQIVLLFDRLTNFKAPPESEDQVEKWEYFSEIIETLYHKLDYLNIIVVSEKPEVVEYLEGNFI